MNAIHLFPSPVWKFSLSNHEVYKKRLVTNLEQTFKTKPNSKAGWAKMCHTWQCHMNEVTVPLKDLYDDIMAEVMKFIIRSMTAGLMYTRTTCTKKYMGIYHLLFLVITIYNLIRRKISPLFL